MYLNPDELSKESLELNSKLRLFQIYKKLKHVSLKNDTYFQVYEDVFNKYLCSASFLFLPAITT